MGMGWDFGMSMCRQGVMCRVGGLVVIIRLFTCLACARRMSDGIEKVEDSMGDGFQRVKKCLEEYCLYIWIGI